MSAPGAERGGDYSSIRGRDRHAGHRRPVDQLRRPGQVRDDAQVGGLQIGQVGQRDLAQRHGVLQVIVHAVDPHVLCLVGDDVFDVEQSTAAAPAAPGGAAGAAARRARSGLRQGKAVPE